MPRGRTFRFTPAGEAALAVDTAAGTGAHAGGSVKSVGLRRRGEGARWDSAALGLGHRRLPKRYSSANTGAKDTHVWTPLTNPAEMEFYRFAVASDPGESVCPHPPPTPSTRRLPSLCPPQRFTARKGKPRGDVSKEALNLDPGAAGPNYFCSPRLLDL